MTGFGVAEIGVFARGAQSGDRYELVLLGSGNLRLRRLRGGAVTVLAEGPSGLTALDAPATLAITARGAAPITLQATVNGVAKLSAVDLGAAAITAAGNAGLIASSSGVAFDNFAVWPAP